MREVAACRQRAAAEGDLAERLRVDAEDHVGDRRLAGAGLADDRQAFAFRDLEGHVIDCAHLAGA